MSVIVPAYNHERYIVDCLESVAQSSHPAIELLILDDGSSDSTFAVAERWVAENSERVASIGLTRQENRGISATLNTLVGMCTGEYVALLASDDMCEPEGLALRLAALERNPEWLTVIGDTSVIGEEGEELYSSVLREFRDADLRALVDPRRVSAELILHWVQPGPGMMTRRSAYSAGSVGLYDENLKVEDRDFYLRVLARGALGYISERVGKLRLNRANGAYLTPQVMTEGIVAAEVKNVTAFRGLNRLFLRIVATQGRLQLASARARRDGRGGRAAAAAGAVLGVVRACAYRLHRLTAAASF